MCVSAIGGRAVADSNDYVTSCGKQTSGENTAWCILWSRNGGGRYKGAL